MALVLLTDGFMERQSLGGEQFGASGCPTRSRHHAGGSAAELLRAIDLDVGGFAGDTAQEDDMTAVVLHGQSRHRAAAGSPFASLRTVEGQ